jgi:hypothetical protein
MRAPSLQNSDVSNDRCYEELEEVFDHFPTYHTTFMSRDFNAKFGGEDIYTPKIGNECLHQDSNDNVVRIVNLSHQKF